MSRWAIIVLAPPKMADEHPEGSFFQFYSNGDGRSDHKIWEHRDEVEEFKTNLEARYPHVIYQVVNYDDLFPPEGAKGGTDA